MEGIVRIHQFGHDPCGRSHWHSSSYFLNHRFYFPIEGEAFVTLGGQRFRLAPGQAYFIPGLQVVDHACPVACDMYWLHFECVSLNMNLRLARLSRAIEWPIERWDFWRSTITEWPSAIANPKAPISESQELAAHAMTIWGISLLLKQEKFNLEKNPNKLIHRLEPAVRYIEEHFATVPRLEELAELVHMSPKYFHRCFREVFETTPREYIERCRIQQAEHLLQETDRSVAEIAEAVGYQNPFHFSQVFKKRLGISPRKFRQATEYRRM